MQTSTKNKGLKKIDSVHGVLLIDKPARMTSHDVVAAIRRHFLFKKVGHGGTLDPLATGLLPILIGRGTKLSHHIMDSHKVYEGTMHLGISTDSQDAEGKIVSQKEMDGITQEKIEEEMQRWTGDIMQTPPMVSAVKKEGVPLYKLARREETVERTPRLKHIYTFDMLSFSPPYVSFRVQCTKGTYVRTLCSDMGDDLGCGAHVSALRRIETGTFHVENSLHLDKILEMPLTLLQQQIIPIHQVRTDPS
ncbi:MAG: tRNA pseudouridine(55) synthase TruB [Kiritimatiellae bacterium]|nr:tRNA pseudouridine(55) synthase TruB [Kiritimatiellia bacterium]